MCAHPWGMGCVRPEDFCAEDHNKSKLQHAWLWHLVHRVEGGWPLIPPFLVLPLHSAVCASGMWHLLQGAQWDTKLFHWGKTRIWAPHCHFLKGPKTIHLKILFINTPKFLCCSVRLFKGFFFSYRSISLILMKTLRYNCYFYRDI